MKKLFLFLVITALFGLTALPASARIITPASPGVDGHNDHNHDHEETIVASTPSARDTSPTTIPNQPGNKRGYVPPPAAIYSYPGYPARIRSYPAQRTWYTRSYPAYYPSYYTYSYAPVVYYGSYYGY